jgi:Lrp/AsnC family transcriptional regulator, leucine-responsive regulatory protein
MPEILLDKTDYALLAYLQHDGRATNVQLADHLNLSETPCWRRLKRLEAEGIIDGYQANLNHRKLGFDIMAFVQVVFSVHTDEQPEKFEQTVQGIPEILSCYNVTGEADYILVVVAKDLAAYEKLLRTTIRKMPGVTSLKTMLSLREIKGTTALPL